MLLHRDLQAQALVGSVDQSWKRFRRVSVVFTTMDDCEPLLVETTIIKSPETESIRPITVYQALQAECLPNDVQFSLDGVKFSKASHCYLNVSNKLSAI
jgi:hypothetical protein